MDGAVVSFRLRRQADYPAVASVKDFFSMVKSKILCLSFSHFRIYFFLTKDDLMKVNSAFNGKRKMLRKSLQHLRTPHEIEEALCNVGLPVTVCYLFQNLIILIAE